MSRLVDPADCAHTVALTIAPTKSSWRSVAPILGRRRDVSGSFDDRVLKESDEKLRDGLIQWYF
jgi:hypothetical protein